MHYAIRRNDGMYLKTAFSKAVTEDISNAYKWAIYEKALNVINNLHDKAYDYQIIYIEGNESCLNDVAEEETEIDYEEMINFIVESNKKLHIRKNVLSNKHRNIEAKIVDLYHEIEFSTCNVVQGYKEYKKLKDALVDRRNVKTELEEIYNGSVVKTFFQSFLSELIRA